MRVYKDTAGVEHTQIDPHRNCGKDPKILIQINYSKIHDFRKLEGRYSDVIGFCSEHGELLLKDRSAWFHKSSRNRCVVKNLRGSIESVQKVDPAINHEGLTPKEVALREDKQRTLDYYKGRIIGMMSQSNTQRLTPDDWKSILDAVLQDWITMQVMES
jgi:hypothetical protein